MVTDLTDELITNLVNARHLERLDLRLLQRGVSSAQDDQVRDAYRRHQEETQEHLRLVEERLEAYGRGSELGSGRSCVGAIEIRYVDDLPHTPTQLALSAYAFENLEIALYHLLARLAGRVEDDRRVKVASEILEEEEQTAELLASLFDRALTVTLRQQLPGAGSSRSIPSPGN